MNTLCPAKRRGAWAASGLVLFAILLPSCKPRASDSSVVSPRIEGAPTTSSKAPVPMTTSSPATQDVVAAPHIPLDDLDLPENALLAAATQENWDSERIAEQVASRLDDVEYALFSSGQPQGDFDSWVAKDVRVGELRPQSLVPLFQDSSFTVLVRDSESDPRDLGHGRAAMRQQLAMLGDLGVAPGTLRYEHKTIQLSLDETEVATKSLVHIAGVSRESAMQINLAWECVWSRDATGKIQLRGINTTDYEEVHARAAAFDDCTQSVLGDTNYWREILSRSTDHWLERLETRYGLDPAAWHGLAVGDIDNDGLDDIYVCQPGGIPNGLLRQRLDGTTEEIGERAGVNLYDQTQSALLVDLDNDGDQDLALAISMGLMVLANDGKGHFSAVAARLIPGGIPYSLSAADYDQDGDLDLYACCYAKRKSQLDHRFLGRPIPYHDANNGARNVLFRNNGQWKFQDVTKSVGLSDNNLRFSFAASWEDYDNDGDLDLYVANDYGRNNLYRNQNGTFVDVAAEAGVEDMSAGMSVSWGDVNNDGWMDLYVSNMFSSAGNRVTYQRQFKHGIDAKTRAEFQRHARGNSLFINLGNGTFSDASTSARVTMGRWAWGSTLVDLNNDGLKDILVANGFLTQEKPDDL